MQFNSYYFILYFLPLTVCAYFLANKVHVSFGKGVLLLASCVFYTKFVPETAIVLGISLLINFVAAKLLSRTKEEKWGFLPVVLNLLILLYFKYTNFAIANINAVFGTSLSFRMLSLPLGISFFTFQQIAYLISVKRKEVEAVNCLDYFLYILYFPKILMGPLMEPTDFLKQLNDAERKNVNAEHLLQGIQIFSFGLFKKMVLADTFAKSVNWGFGHMEHMGSVEWLLIMLFYTFQIYFDFSGYSDMAVGSSWMLNIRLPINFDSPYKAHSVRDFWKRWHISLTKFFTKYLYIPLGGSRKGQWITYRNTFLVFLVSGIWHGANWTFILWGVLYGILMIVDRVCGKYFEKLPKVLRWIGTFVLINVLWLLFRAESVGQWLYLLKTIVSFEGVNIHENLIRPFFLTGIIGQSIHGFWMYVYLFAAFLIMLFPDNNYRKLERVNAVTILAASLAFVWALIRLGGESVFVYFNF